MITLIAYVMILLFMGLVISRKVSAFAGLIISSLLAGLAVCGVSGKSPTVIFDWIKAGLFYSVNESGDVSLGTVNATIMILFAIMYFSLMMNVGLFDPICTFLIRKAKGDPLKVILVAAFVATVVTMDGDGTTTILIVTSAFVPLFKKMKMKLSYLAMLIIIPTGIGNLLPWGGPLARAASVINVEVNELFVRFLPLMAAGIVYVIALAFFLGNKERKRLGYVSGKNEIINQEQIEEMCLSITELDKEYKRPKRFLINLVMTVALIVALIAEVASGAILFVIGTALALIINYNEKDQRKLITINGGEAIAVTSIIVAAGIFMGILNGSGMADAIASSLLKIIPESLGGHTALFFAFIGAIACYALPVDAYYFGILPVVVPLAAEFGIAPMEMTMAAFMGQAIRYASPLVPWLFLLIERTEMSFGEYQKEFFKYSIPLFFIYIIGAILLGLFPV